MDPTCFILDVAQISCLNSLFGRIVGLFSSLASVIFFIMVTVGGFKFLFSGGNPKAVESAKGTLTAAFLGLILIVSGYIILRLIESYTGFKLSIFEIKPF